MAIKICLDAGHYGKYNQSPVVPEYYESDMTWNLHLKLKAELESYGFEVSTTRSKQETDLELTKRGKKSKGCDLFLSLHSNGAQREDADHVVIFTLINDDTTDIDEKSMELAKKFAPKITELMGVKETEYRIATNKSSNDRNGDGILNDNYYGVLHGARTVGTPALIIEHSFHTNTRSTKWLLKEANLDKLAKMEAEILAEHFGMKKQQITYRIQVGAYITKKNAEKMQVQLKTAGFDGFIAKEGLHYKVQVGAYKLKSNASKMMTKLKENGFSAFITENII